MTVGKQGSAALTGPTSSQSNSLKTRTLPTAYPWFSPKGRVHYPGLLQERCAGLRLNYCEVKISTFLEKEFYA
jgi:hypothetical protein